MRPLAAVLFCSIILLCVATVGASHARLEDRPIEAIFKALSPIICLWTILTVVLPVLVRNAVSQQLSARIIGLTVGVMFSLGWAILSMEKTKDPNIRTIGCFIGILGLLISCSIGWIVGKYFEPITRFIYN